MEAFEREYLTEYGKRLPMRNERKRPMSANCPMHLRRVCGTCAAFPEGADMRAKTQPCARLQIAVNGTRCAAHCRLWSRKPAASNGGKANA